MNQISFSKFALFICLLALAGLITTTAFAQDTIYCRKVRVSKWVGIYKSGRILHAHPTWKKVKNGFIIRKSQTLYLIDGEEYKPGDNKPLKIRK